MANIIMSCCVLHNLRMDNGDSEIDNRYEEEEEEQEESEVRKTPVLQPRRAKSVDTLLRQLGHRNAITCYHKTEEDRGRNQDDLITTSRRHKKTQIRSYSIEYGPNGQRF
ncbi:hypothetical protein HPB47_016885 [Ixodes persulcatus]|uniref:Uncharacterized protein n=1 Tax=Ixodes persulcatus TaxID=34615 RepID=A0AC60QQS2_IXOPE|nr:hypothetical protein HPB47_016885 [Ixodes persulcatus]